MKFSWKKSLLVICKILGLFVNILNADHLYFLLNRENLRQPIQMQLSQIQKIFPQFFSTILKSKLNFEHFQKTTTLIADAFVKLRTTQKRG